MDRHPRRVLPRLGAGKATLLGCPICVAPEAAAMAEGAQQGALFLIVVASLVGLAVVRFAWRLWRLERAATATRTVPHV
jgi:hypothetical protein